MLLTHPVNRASRSERRRFEQLFAQYRSQVLEAHYRAFHQAHVPMEDKIQVGLERPTVLVVEDNTDEWFLIRYGLLCQYPGAECIWLSEPTGVASYLDQHAQSEKELPRLIVLDLYLPSAQKGLHVLQELKSHPLYQTIPVVVFSRSADPADITEVFTYSANSYVIKPTTPAEWQTIFTEFGKYWQGPAVDKETFPNHNR